MEGVWCDCLTAADLAENTKHIPEEGALGGGRGAEVRQEHRKKNRIGERKEKREGKRKFLGTVLIIALKCNLLLHSAQAASQRRQTSPLSVCIRR